MELVFKKWIENVKAWSYNGAGIKDFPAFRVALERLESLKAGMV